MNENTSDNMDYSDCDEKFRKWIDIVREKFFGWDQYSKRNLHDFLYEMIAIYIVLLYNGYKNPLLT